MTDRLWIAAGRLASVPVYLAAGAVVACLWLPVVGLYALDAVQPRR